MISEQMRLRKTADFNLIGKTKGLRRNLRLFSFDKQGWHRAAVDPHTTLVQRENQSCHYREPRADPRHFTYGHSYADKKGCCSTKASAKTEQADKRVP